MKKITYSKHVSRCPHCGKRMYYRVCIDGIELDDDNYGMCYNKNSNCFPFKNSDKHFTFSVPKIVGNQSLADRLLADAYDSEQDRLSTAPYKITQDDIIGFAEIDVADNNIYGSTSVDILSSMKDYGVRQRKIHVKQKDGAYKDVVILDYWYIDILGNYRDCKGISYKDGHRDKAITPMWGRQTIAYNHVRTQRFMATSEIQKAKEEWLQHNEFKLCLFGEQLLSEYPTYPVFVFEAEKTAVMVHAYLQSIGKKAVCLAAGCKGRLSPEHMSVLNGRKVFLFPDADDTTIVDRFSANKEVRIVEWWKNNKHSVMYATYEELYDCTGGTDIVSAKIDFADVLSVRLGHKQTKKEYYSAECETKETVNYSAATW